MTTPTPPENAPIGLPDADAQRRPRLLVVDDQPVNVQTLYRVFAEDHQVFMATGGEQALVQAVARLPDLVLLDVEMPDLDGYEVCRCLKAHEATRDIPVIFVTAHQDEDSETKGLDAGAVDFITKPINPRIVRARVRTHLTLKRQGDLMRQWVYVDGLTGVCNRRHFDERLATEYARAVRQGDALSLVMIDVDFFKRFNDHYGHQAGDDALRRVAEAVRSGLKRPGDLLARYGGEEFVCLLPDTDRDGAMSLAAQFGDQVRAMEIENVNADSGRLTISLGVATKPPDVVGGAAALLRAADAELYVAKAAGRDRASGTELDGP